MFLKRLEVIGFKSFAERIGIDFVPGVTAVVGPNGSGKSNVTDAIRWVLGEQSAKSLRGAKMEDVIFAGSDSRKPLNFAEVTLILDNEDERMAVPYTEISVTRRVYRSGDSEYLLNNHACRLKDITDLFMDSGLGKEAFSIISQGRVDEILNSRPDDRRSIFEEAAGVLKYKQRKRKAEHKLVETDDNLNRVLDILHEIDTRLEPLKMQASSANDHIRMTTELKDFDISLIVHDLQQSAEQLQEVEVEYAKLKTIEGDHSLKIVAIESKMKEIRSSLKQIDDVLDASQEALVEASSEVERWEGRKALLNEKQSNNEKHIQQLETQLEQAQQALKQLQGNEAEKRALHQEKQQEVQKLKSVVKQLEQALSRTASEIEQEIDNKKNNYINLLNEEATAKNELKHIEQQLAVQNETAERMSGRSAEIQQQLSTIGADKLRVSELLHKAQLAVNELQAQFEVSQGQLKATTTEFDEKQVMLYKAYQHHQQLKSRQETLAELESDFSGFFHGVKEVLLARDKGELTGIEGAVAELIQVKGEFSQAIETALGAASQHIVTETEQHAQKAIGWLKQKRAGRATFLPKSVMKSRKLFPAQISLAMDHPSFVNIAYELVTFDESNRTIVENLLGNVLVAKDLQGASQIARLLGFKFRVVTLEGDIVNAGGSLTGGATKQQTSLFTRKAELEKLTDTIVAMSQSIEQAEQKVTQLKAQIGTLREQIEMVRQQLDLTREEERTYRSRLAELEITEKSLQANVTITTSEHSNVSTMGASLAEQKESVSNRLEQLQAELLVINTEVEELTIAKLQSESQKDVLREQLAENKATLAVAQEQHLQLQASIAQIQMDVAKAQKLIDNLLQEMEWLQSEDGEQGPSLDEISATVMEWSAKKDALTNTIQQKRDERTAQQAQIEEMDANFTELQRVHKGYLDAIRSIEVRQSRLQYELSSLSEQLEESYELDFNSALEVAVEIEDVDVVRRKVKLLKQSIEELGPVNLTAIEEYERVVERYAFLTEQHDDLLKAKETLHNAIGEMDEEMTARFTETFNAVREQFKISFRELFGGGQADLVCTDPSNMLETGIEIIAQPPGKKLQNLSLLSGGERALTAIALLFAILNTRPVPFCILDEVEAALDEANVTRYSEYLKKFSAETQFIVITHRKGTMEGADVLYGITMQESGVSKLVSVKLEEAQETA